MVFIEFKQITNRLSLFYKIISNTKIDVQNNF